MLLCDYGPEGAFGLVLNRPTDMPASAMVRLEPPIVGGNDMPLWIGGPVEPERGWILLGRRAADAEFKSIRDGLYLSTSQVLLREVLEARPAPRARVIAGYAGWGPGQLDDELAQSSWLMGDVDLDIVFDIARRRDVGDRDPPARRRSVDADDEPRRALTRVAGTSHCNSPRERNQFSGGYMAEEKAFTRFVRGSDQGSVQRREPDHQGAAEDGEERRPIRSCAPRSRSISRKPAARWRGSSRSRKSSTSRPRARSARAPKG